MFGNCCGRKKAKKKPIAETKDAETQSEYELLTIDENPTQNEQKVAQDASTNTTDTIRVSDVDSDKDKECDNDFDTGDGTAIVDQPLTTTSKAKVQEEDLEIAEVCEEINAESTETETNENFEVTLQEISLEVVDNRRESDVEIKIEVTDVTSSNISETEILINDNENENELDNEIHHEHEHEDDDEVFAEGVGPPIKLAKNMGKPLAKGQVHCPLPKWFSEEDDQEVGGIQEPPATPIGKDELALRRHRFFSELISAAQNATEHKVHFDPLGPSVAGVDLPHSQELEQLVSRLENVTSRLENVCQPVQEILKLSSCSTLQDFLDSPKEETSEVDVEEAPNKVESNGFADLKEVERFEQPTAMSVYGFQDVMQGPFAQYLAISQQLGGDVATHSQMVKNAFDHQLKYLIIAAESKQPNQNEINNLIQPTAKCIQTIQEFREKSRGSAYFNHLSAISESIPALGWVAVSPTPAPYVKEMNDAGQFYTNRVLKDWKEKDKKHVDWVKSWVQTLTELQAFVKQHHTTGLVWAGKKAAPAGAPPPPPGPPPPPMCDLSDLTIDPNSDRSALFEQLNQGSDITRSLKKVTDDMQTHKNPTLRTGPAPFKASTNQGGGICNVKAPVADKPPVFVREGKKWLIEYQKGNHNLLVDGAEMNNVVYLYRCADSTVSVKGKINSIVLDSCKKTSVVCDSLVSSIEFINCQSVQMQVLGKVPTISIDKTDGCQMYLSSESLNVEIVSSKSSEMNVLVPKPNGDYAEYPIPEQYKTTVVPGGLSTVIVESKG